MDRLSEALRRSPHVGVVFLDIDRFKVINDGMGHTIGDRILALVAERLERALRPGDTVGRLGGDEFVVILDGVEDRDRAMAASSRLAWALDAPFHVNDADLFITVSQGVALAHADDSAEAVLSRADHAMYWAKDQGRARAEFADPHVVERAWTRFTLETSLRGAVDRGELVVHYQPLVELQNGAVVGAEALVRWQHPELGLLAPADFLPLAEETGLIVPIGEFVLQQALRDSGPWIEAAGRQGLPFDIAINISATQLAVPNLPFVVARALSASGVDASRVHLEITESVLMRDVERSIQILTALKELGVHIDIDDFGTGYSSLTYVQRLPVDRLKVDKSFVDRLTPAEDDSSIINAVLTLSRALHLDIIAEGVETPHQEKVLCDLGCGLAQGYLFAKPMEAAQFSDLVIEDRLEREAS
jgi:diguanylate cyclase (GGDEF)-like protein